MRDPETVDVALKAAETGHLVLGTLHTNSAPQTINRIVNVSDLSMEGLDKQDETPFTVETGMTLTAYTQGPANVPAVEPGAEQQLNASVDGNQTKTANAGAAN